jgi:hypothetical protein
MSKIDTIKNITVIQDLGTASDFYQKFNINNQPDECIIRSVSYVGPTVSDISGTYLLWSDMINDFICSFSACVNTNDLVNITTHIINTSPQRTIHFKHPINFSNNIRFVLYRIGSGNNIADPSTLLTGELAVLIDFITYKK